MTHLLSEFRGKFKRRKTESNSNRISHKLYGKQYVDLSSDQQNEVRKEQIRETENFRKSKIK